MASFYSTTSNPGNNNNFGGNFGATGYGNGGSTNNENVGESGFQQFQQQPQQTNVQQWKAKPQGQSYGHPSQHQSQQQQQQHQSTQPFWMPGVQQAATQAAAGFIAGNLSSDQVLTKGMDEIGKAFGGGIPGMNYVMNILRSYFAVDNDYVKRKMLKVLFPFTNKQWMREVSNCLNVLYLVQLENVSLSFYEYAKGLLSLLMWLKIFAYSCVLTS